MDSCGSGSTVHAPDRHTLDTDHRISVGSSRETKMDRAMCVVCGDVKQTKTNKHGKEVCEECYKLCCAECHGEFGEDCAMPLHEGGDVCADCDPNLGAQEEEEVCDRCGAHSDELSGVHDDDVHDVALCAECVDEYNYGVFDVLPSRGDAPAQIVEH